MKKPKSKRPPRDPEVMKKAWETRRRNQARRADPLARSLGEAHDEYRKRDRKVGTTLVLDPEGFLGAKRAGAKMLREEIADANQAKTELSQAMLEAAKGMNETLYGDTRHCNSFLEQYKTVVRYKEYLENLGFKVTYDPF